MVIFAVMVSYNSAFVRNFYQARPLNYSLRERVFLLEVSAKMRANILSFIWNLACAGILSYWLFKTVEKLVDFFR